MVVALATALTLCRPCGCHDLLQRNMQGLPICIKVNKRGKVEGTFHRMAHTIMHSRKEERTEGMLQLAEAGIQDRTLKGLFFNVRAHAHVMVARHGCVPALLSLRLYVCAPVRAA